MQFSAILQPAPFTGTSAYMSYFAPPDDESVVPNPFAIPPEWLEVWEEDERMAMETAKQASEQASDASSKETKDASNAAKKAKGMLDDVSGAISSAVSGAISAASNAANSIGQSVGQGAGQGLVDTVTSAIPNVVSQTAQAVKTEGTPLVGALSREAGSQATSGALDQLKNKDSGLPSPTALLVGGVAVLGALGLGAYLLSDNSPKAYPLLPPPTSSTPMLGMGALKADENESGLGAGIAFVGGVAGIAFLAGYVLKNGLPWKSDKASSGPASTNANAMMFRSSPLHPYSLAASLGMSSELLHLDPSTILGPNPSQQDHDDFFSGYPIGHTAGASNCDAARLHKQGIAYQKDPSKSQMWDNGWLKGYYDGWVAEGCTAGIKKASGPIVNGVDLANVNIALLKSQLLPWQQTSLQAQIAKNPNFGNDLQTLIRVLAITPAQLQKASTGAPTITSSTSPSQIVSTPTSSSPSPSAMDPVLFAQQAVPDDDS